MQEAAVTNSDVGLEVRAISMLIIRSLGALSRTLALLAVPLLLLFIAGCTAAPATPTAQPPSTRPPVSTAVAVPSPSAAVSPSPSPGVGAIPSPSIAPLASPSAQVGAFTVQMTNQLRFEPAQLTVPRGTTVTWTNTSSVQHSVTDDASKAINKADAELPAGAQPWDSGLIDPGKTFEHAFDVPGTYKYFCIPHETAGMVGTIIVSG